MAAPPLLHEKPITEQMALGASVAAAVVKRPPIKKKAHQPQKNEK